MNGAAHEPAPESPFKGLVPYGEKDARFFFGRDAERQIIIANLIASRLTVLYGASGAGKSSVLHAGVATGLRRLAREQTVSYGAPEQVVVTFSAWRDDPVAGLIACIAASVGEAIGGATGQPAPAGRSLVEAIRYWSERFDGELLIVLDQFEEYFLYHGFDEGAGTFDQEFPRAVNNHELRVSFLISIREDAVARLDRFKGRIGNLFDNYLRVDHLTVEAAREAIVRPVEEFNVDLSADRQFQVEPGLVDAVLEQVRTGQVKIGDSGRGAVIEAGDGGQIETPFLQLVMTRLWSEEVAAGSRVLRMATLERLGGAERIVRTHLDATMGTLGSEEREIAARLFRHLVTPSGTKIAHTVADLADYAGVDQAQILSVLEALSAGGVRIIRPVAPPPDSPSTPRYEIFHDVLAAAILDWRRRYTEEQDRERFKLEEAERQQREHEQATRLLEQRQTRMFRRGVVVLALLLTGAIGLAWWAINSRARAEKAFHAEQIAHRRADSTRAAAIEAKVREDTLRNTLSQILERDDGAIEEDPHLAMTLVNAAQEDTALRRSIDVSRIRTTLNASKDNLIWLGTDTAKTRPGRVTTTTDSRESTPTLSGTRVVIPRDTITLKAETSVKTTDTVKTTTPTLRQRFRSRIIRR